MFSFSDILFLLKNDLNMIQKLFRSIIAIQNHGDKIDIFILIVENIKYRGDVSWNVPVWSCSLSKK